MHHKFKYQQNAKVSGSDCYILLTGLIGGYSNYSIKLTLAPKPLTVYTSICIQPFLLEPYVST